MSIWNSKAKSMTEDEGLPAQETKEESSLPALNEPSEMTIIAKDLTIKGDVQGSGVVQVEGVVEGRIDLKGVVEVMPTGTVIGPIQSDEVYVAGNVQGNIDARSTIRLESTGVVDGDVTTVSFVIEDGGLLNGRTTMAKPKKETGGQESQPFAADFQPAAEPAQPALDT